MSRLNGGAVGAVHGGPSKVMKRRMTVGRLRGRPTSIARSADECAARQHRLPSDLCTSVVPGLVPGCLVLGDAAVDRDASEDQLV